MNVPFKYLFFFCIIVQYSNGFVHFGHIMKELLEDYKLHHAIYNHTSKSVQSCPDYEKEIQKAATESDECLDKYNLNEKAFCRFMKNDFRLCMHPFKNVLEKCLPSKSREMPTFLIDTVIALANFVCTETGETLFELSNPCVHYIFKTRNECQERFEIEMAKVQKNFPTKSEVCSTSDEFRQCLKKQLEQECGSSVTRKAVLDLYDATFNDCHPDSKIKQL